MPYYSGSFANAYFMRVIFTQALTASILFFMVIVLVLHKINDMFTNGQLIFGILFAIAFIVFGTIVVIEKLLQYGDMVTSRAGGSASCALALGAVACTSQKMKATKV